MSFLVRSLDGLEMTSPPSKNETPVRPLKGIAILLLDIDPGSRRTTECQLASAGATVIATEGAVEGLAVAKVAWLDAIVANADRNSTHADALIREILDLEHHRVHAPVVVGLLNEGRDPCGTFDLCLVQPYEGETLVEAVRSLVSRRRQDRTRSAN